MKKYFSFGFAFFLFFYSCQKRSFFKTNLIVDPKIQQIKNNYEKDENSQHLSLQPQWAAADLYSDKNGFVLIPIGERLDLVALSIDPPAFIYQKTLPTGRKKERIRLLYDVFGMLQMALYEHEGRTDFYLLKAEQRYAFHHINSREQKYQSWKDFDFEDFEFVDVKDLNALSSIFLAREDLLYCAQLLQAIIKRFKDKTDAIGNDPQYLMPMPGYPFLMVLNNEGAKKNCEAAKEAAASILATPCPSNYPLAAVYLSYCDAVQPDCRTGDCPSVCPGDPLENMEILPSGETGHNMDGGRFGEKVRKEKNKEGKLVDRDHWGTDFKADIGTPVYAMHDGMVDFSGFSPKNPQKNEKCYVDKTDNICKGSWGNYVQITSTIDGQKVQMLYAHFSELGVNSKQKIKQGDLLGYSGNTGNAQTNGVKPHLHVEAWDPPGSWPPNSQNRKNPEKYLNSQFGSDGKLIKNCKK